MVLNLDPSTHLWKETPLVLSHRLSSRTTSEHSIYLKLENLHPCYSFKYRGISHFIKTHVDQSASGQSTRFVIASGGNAGLAAACATKALGVKCTIFIPVGASDSILSVFKEEGAEVILVGTCYAEALKEAERAVALDKDAVMVPAYDDHTVIEGHSSMIHEIRTQMDIKPDAIVCSVGGAGLLGGILKGCEDVGWDDVPVVGVETVGSDCFYHSVGLNSQRSDWPDVTLPSDFEVVEDPASGFKLAHQLRFNSAASGSLGASLPSPIPLKKGLERSGGLICVTIPDALAMQALCRFADDQKHLVEMSCATALSLAYKPSFLQRILPGAKTIVFVVCGGFKVSLADIPKYQSTISEDAAKPNWTVLCNGRPFEVLKQE